MDITSEGLDEMFEDDFADMRAAHVDGVLSGVSSVSRPVSKDPHWRDRKFLTLQICAAKIVRSCQ